MRAALSQSVRVGLRILFLSIPILALFAATALACSGVIATWKSVAWHSAAAWLPGTVCGLIVWLMVSALHLAKESRSLPLGDRDAFLARLNRELMELGYNPVRLSLDAILFKPAFTSYLLGGWIQVSLEKDTARLRGPKAALERLVRRLRLNDFIRKEHSHASDSMLKQGKHLVKRVQINFRVPHHQWDDVREAVLETLTQEGANVVCEVSILAQSDSGIHRRVVDSQVRDWLRDQRIRAVLHKEYLVGPDKSRERLQADKVNEGWDSISEVRLDELSGIGECPSEVRRVAVAVAAGVS